MLRSSGFFALAVAALLVNCYAEPRQDSDRKDGDNTAESYETSGFKTQHLDSQNDDNQVRQARETQPYDLLSYVMTRRHDHSSPSNAMGRRRAWPSYRFGGFPDEGYPKRNFDEIDLSGLNTFVQKRKMDED